MNNLNQEKAKKKKKKEAYKCNLCPNLNLTGGEGG